MINRALYWLFLFFIVAACRQVSQEKQNDLHFDINPKILGYQYQDTTAGLTISVPKGWLPISRFDSTTIQKFKDMKSMGNVTAIYLDSLQEGTLIVSSLKEFDSTTFNLVYEQPDTLLNKQKEWSQILKSKFLLNDMNVFQFLLQGTDLICFKFIIVDGLKQPSQIDYVLSRNTYIKNVKKVESSIGTISPL